MHDYPEGFDPAYEPAPTLDAFIRPLVTTSHDRHVDMMHLVSGLPDGALGWEPTPDAPALAGLTLHVLDVESHVARLAKAYDPDWTGELGTRIREDAPRDALIAEIARVDAELIRALEEVTDGRLRAPAGNGTVAKALLEDLDHAAVHLGQMQLTRSLWEAAHPEAPKTYEHWA